MAASRRAAGRAQARKPRASKPAAFTDVRVPAANVHEAEGVCLAHEARDPARLEFEALGRNGVAAGAMQGLSSRLAEINVSVADDLAPLDGFALDQPAEVGARPSHGG